MIRRVTRYHKLYKRPKVVRDYRLKVDMELIYGNSYHECRYVHCPNHQVIAPHEFYVKVVGPEDRKPMGNRMIPAPRIFHLYCVPPELRPMTRFFRRD